MIGLKDIYKYVPWLESFDCAIALNGSDRLKPPDPNP